VHRLSPFLPDPLLIRRSRPIYPLVDLSLVSTSFRADEARTRGLLQARSAPM
jgi:hypothetical protein